MELSRSPPIGIRNRLRVFSKSATGRGTYVQWKDSQICTVAKRWRRGIAGSNCSGCDRVINQWRFIAEEAQRPSIPLARPRDPGEQITHRDDFDATDASTSLAIAQ